MLKRLKTVTETRFRKTDINSFVFFLVFAIIIWVFVQFSKQYNQVLDIPLKYVNVPPDKLLKEDNPDHLQLRMQDNGFTIAWFSLFPPSLTIDVSRAIESDGQLVYLIDENRNHILQELNIDFEHSSFVRDAVVIDYEQKEEKMLPVISQIKIEFAAGYSGLDDLHIEPDSVMVSGPNNILDTLQAVRTFPTTFSRVKNDLSGSVALDTTALPTVTFYRSRVNYSMDVERFTEGKLQVPIELTNVPDGLNVVIFPRETCLLYTSPSPRDS